MVFKNVKSQSHKLIFLYYTKKLSSIFMKIALNLVNYFFNFAITFSINSSSVNAFTGLPFTKVNVFLRPGPQYE